MSKVERGGPGTLVGQEFYDIEQLRTISFCPTNDGSGPATQVHTMVYLKAPPTMLGLPRKASPAPMVMRFKGTDTLDDYIEALIEHRTYVFGRREWSAAKYPTQKEDGR